jgi:hypothetical protein
MNDPKLGKTPMINAKENALNNETVWIREAKAKAVQRLRNNLSRSRTLSGDMLAISLYEQSGNGKVDRDLLCENQCAVLRLVKRDAIAHYLISRCGLTMSDVNILNRYTE